MQVEDIGEYSVEFRRRGFNSPKPPSSPIHHLVVSALGLIDGAT